jgi:hypothetical protein
MYPGIVLFHFLRSDASVVSKCVRVGFIQVQLLFIPGLAHACMVSLIPMALDVFATDAWNIPFRCIERSFFKISFM